ncbi:MAG: carboxypeptidase regulatory-like domain-containing protein [Ignavibacteriales bacterium]|nr:carboxypeptidase regulatory-like domain-containing protein [Ignavibacteriales bacterium]
MLKVKQLFSFFVFLVMMFSSQVIFSQGVTTAALNGLVLDQKGEALPGANIIAVHVPSGTTYGASSRVDGRFNIPGMRVGGPYKVTVSFVGYENQVKENIFLNLGVASDVRFTMSETNIEIGEITVAAQRDAVFSSDRTGAATSVNVEALKALPTISRRIGDFTRLTPQASGNSFAGQDTRFNNITVDGSYFNNSFGLQGQPGDRTGVAPISLDAIEQVQVNIAPYDVRQGNFVGAGVNMVTKSGTNEFSGTAYYQYRNEDLVGTKAGDNTFNPGTFKYNQVGLNLGGPIIQNKLFFFTSFESDEFVEPGTTFRANLGGETVGGSITRVLSSDLTQLSNFLKTNFGYETGAYQGYDHETPATRFLAKFDYNLDDNNKISLRYTHLDSDTDVLASNSSSLGAGNRRSNSTGLNFQNSNYKIKENIRSLIGEWNTRISDNMSNNLIIGYTYQDESRGSRGSMFPFVDILQGGSTYTSFGFELFTPNNELRYKTFQVQDNFTIYGVDHNLTFGISAERYSSENIFFPGSQSVYVYNSLEDFYTDANDYLLNPSRTTSPVTLNKFQVRWSNIPGQTKPVQPLKVFYTGIYGQDEWQVTKDIKLTLGLRLDIPFFDETGYANYKADSLSFRDEDGSAVKYSTAKLPDANILFSPRLGFNWDVFGDRTTQVRGGSGIFTGKPAYVWISNQIGNTGVLTGFEQVTNKNTRPFNPNPDAYKPTNVTGQPASSYELALTDPDFKFPQLWRNNIAVDQKLPLDLFGTLEFLYSKDVNGIYYINANLPAAQSAFTGADNRPRWTSNRLYSNVSNAIVMKNEDVGYSWNIAASLEKPFADGWFAKAAYSYGVSKNTVDAGSIASGSWFGNAHSGDPNNPGAAFTAYSPGSRIFATVSYRKEYFDFGATTISLYWEGYSTGTASYTFSGDLNGDGGSSNDLIYISRDASEMNFVDKKDSKTGNVLFTAAQQAEAWNAFIEQDDYLKEHRGEYAERNGILLPMVFRADLSIVQEVFTDLFEKRNTLQFRLDVLNVGNLLNKNWGVADRLVTTTPLITPNSKEASSVADAQGRSQYTLQAIGGKLISKSLQQSTFTADVYRIQLSVRYMFN